MAEEELWEGFERGSRFEVSISPCCIKDSERVWRRVSGCADRFAQSIDGRSGRDGEKSGELGPLSLSVSVAIRSVVVSG